MTAKLIDDCFVLDKDRLPHDEAIAILKSRVRPVVGVENVSLAEASGRFLAEDLVSAAPHPSPRQCRGRRIRLRLLALDDQAKGTRLRVAGQAAAGHPFRTSPPPDEAVRIFTGAVMPQGFDMVAMQEDVRLERAARQMWAFIPARPQTGRQSAAGRRGCQGRRRLVAAGARLRPQDVAAAASTGLNRLDCYAKLKVAILSTGDEILRAGEAFAPGKVYDANAPMLEGLIRVAGAEAVDLGVLPGQGRARCAPPSPRRAARFTTC